MAGFGEGERVVICGLTARPELNGREAVVLRACPAGAERVPVRCVVPTGGAHTLQGAAVQVRPRNLRRVAAAAEEGQGAEDAGSVAAAALASQVGPDLAGEVLRRVQCARCKGPFSKGGRCRVAHPPHLQANGGGSLGHGVERETSHCKACERSYTVTHDIDYTRDEHNNCHGVRTNRRVEDGPEWCFEGEHTMGPLPESDLRRDVTGEVVNIQPREGETAEALQERIDELPVLSPGARVLVIQSAGMSYDSDLRVTCALAMPELEEVQLIDIAFSAVTLNEELTPKVRKLFMQNIPDDCTLELRLPLLEQVSIDYYHGDMEPIDDMLELATKLQTFSSYKLSACQHITFTSNHLTDIKLHRSDCLRSIWLWTPRLASLNLQACYSLEEIDILDSHDLEDELPPGFTPTRFEVSTENAVITREVGEYLVSHPRVIYEGGDDDDDGMGNPMEAHWRQLHGALNGFGVPLPGGADGGNNMDFASFLQVMSQMSAEQGGVGEAIAEMMAMQDIIGDESEDDEDEDESEESEWETTDGEYSDGDDEDSDGDGSTGGGGGNGSGVTITEIE